MDKQGQRFLLALTSATDDADEFVSMFSLEGVVATIGGIMCLIVVLLMCTCKKVERKDGDESIELHQSSKREKKSTVQQTQDVGDTKARTDVEVVVVNGGTAQASSTLPGHSRQASSGSAHMRPTSLRELPEPPISSHHSRNKSLSGVEVLSTSAKGSSGATGGASGAGSDFAYHQHGHHSRNCKSVPSVNVTASMEKDKPHSDGYDHLGPKRSIKPTDYDSLAEPESTDGETPVSETSGVLDGHYSQLRERTYAVVGDVKARAKELFDPYSNVKDKDDGSSDYYSQVKEDPYNDIEDSGGSVSTSFIHRLRQSRDADDLYTTVRDGSGADLKRVLEPRGPARAPASLPPNIGANSGRMLPTPSIPDDDGDAEEEYAVVQKGKGMSEQAAEKGGQPYNDGDISPYGAGPPEPPRLYNDYDSLEESLPTPPGYSREHKYSKVTARESLASMSARNALNPYEMVMDLPENTYATVEGGSGDGVVLRGGATCDTTENRLSQTSGTYAEIGTSGVGLSSSIISSSSSTGGNNSSSSVAPIPPSLDSLHMMTKSQTSSEGDRLSDRHLASPEDSGMSLNIWGDSHDDEDSDGYSTLKKPDSPPQASSLPTIPDSSLITDEDSGEVTLVPNYQTVKDCISDSEAMEAENDPNYESVEEMRAKVALLKAKTTSLDSRTSPFIPNSGTNMHVNTLKGFNTNSSMSIAVDSSGNKDDLLMSGPRRRRLDHDYEEVDLSPPSSPVTPSSSMNHSALSSYHITSVSSSYAASSSQMETEAILDVTEVRERVIQSHMYEELTEVRAKTSEMNRARKSHSLGKNASEDKVKISKKKSEEKVKSSSEKKKVVSEDKRKGGSTDKRKGGAGDKQKGGSEDKRKNAEDKKIASDGKRKGGAEDKRCDSAAINGTRL